MNYLVAGGTRGIGQALVGMLRQQGHRLTVMARSIGDLQVDESVSFIEHDFAADGAELSGLPETLDGVVYCPGTITLRSFRTLKHEHFRGDWDLNFLGAVRLLQACERPLRESRQGSVVLFSTVAVGQGMPMHASIAAAKGAVEGLTRSLAAEWAPAIRVNAIAPALTETSLSQRFFRKEGSREALGSKYPLQRVGTAEDIAQMAAFLLQPNSAWLTGQVIGLDGGMSALRVGP